MAGLGPQVVQVLDFAAARAPELQALHELSQHEDLRSVVDEKLATQRNQRRRRANAFKSHKMPRRLRMQGATAQDQQIQEEEHIALGKADSRSTDKKPIAPVGDKAAKARAKRESKPRCRKHRRRMHLLLEEHSWLKTKAMGDECEEDAAMEAPKWLPTHAWHAKRMLMKERYGHMLAQRRQDKSVSAALTALRKTATLHDASYYGLLALYGLDELLLEMLQLLSDPSGSQFDDRSLFAGMEEGRSVLYHPSQFPSGAITPVSFMWRPVSECSDRENGEGTEESPPRKRQLWIWIHPAAFMEAATAIASACQDVMSERDGSESIEILDRRGHIARLQLRGKSAETMLLNVLKPAEGTVSDDMSDDSDHDDGFLSTSVRELVSKFTLDNIRRMVTRGSGQATVHRILSLHVRDPRLRAPSHPRNRQPAHVSKPNASLLSEPSGDLIDASTDILCPLSGLSLTRDNAEEPDSELILARLESLIQWTTKARDASDATARLTYPYVPSPARQSVAGTDVAEIESSAAQFPTPWSPLWSLSGRSRVRRTFLKDHQLNEFSDAAGDYDSSVPVLLTREPSCFPNTGGWDLILSPEHAPGFLNALVFSGAMVIGLDEHEALATIIQKPSFPRDYPDTTSGREYWDQLANELENEYVKKPKAKRVNYEKLGVDSPFQPNWELLFEGEQWFPKPNTEGDDDEEMESPAALCVLRAATYMEPFPFYAFAENVDDSEERELVPVAVPALIRVSVSVPRRGNLESCSLLYIPTAADFASFREDHKWCGRELNEDVAQLELLGFLSSAVYDRPKSSFRGTAFCACDPLQRLAAAQRDGTSKTLVAMTRTTTSRQLRPVILHVQA